MTIDCAFADLGLPRFVPDRHCRDLFKAKAVRNSTYIWTVTVGYDPARQSFRDGLMTRTKIETEGHSTGNRFDGYAITWHFGYFGAQVVCFGVDDESFNTCSRADLVLTDGQIVPAESFTRQFAPATNRGISWPPKLGLEQIGFGVFASQSPFVNGRRSL
jgi:hypothetical protein